MKKLSRILVAISILIGIAFISNATAEAESNNAPYIGIAPAKASMELIPGQTYTGSFQVTNPGEVDFDYTISVKPYKVSGQDYSKVFDVYSANTLITDWVTLSSTKGHLEPHTASDMVFYTITVPEEIKVCGQYAAIAATAEPKGGDESGVVNVTSAAMIVYAAVDNCDAGLDGNIKIIENNVPTFLFTPPLTTTSLVENNSKVHVDGEYILEVFPLFSDEAIYSNADEEHTSIIMPETKRMKAQKWENAPLIGIFKVRQTIKVYDQESVVEKIVIICPLWLIFLVIFAIIMTVAWFRSRAKARKSNDKKYE